MKQHSFVTEDGREYPIRSISLMDFKEVENGIVAEWKERGEYPEIPTYQVEIAGGDKISYPLSETLLDTPDPIESARRKAAWAVYSEAMDRLAAEQSKALLAIILDGLDVQLPADDTWIARRKKRHIHIPENVLSDPDELLQYYKMSEILKTPGDIVGLQQEILILSSSGKVDRAAVEAAGDTFLRQLQDIGKGEGNTAKRPRQKTRSGQVGAQPDILGD